MRAHTQDLPTWLCANGGPIVRYRTATELPGDTSRIDLARLQRELLACDEVQRWLDNLGAGPIHHSKDTTAENALAKLCEYGLRAGIPALDGKALLYCNLGPDKTYWTPEVIMIPFLVRASYGREPALHDWFLHRLRDLQRTAQHGSYDIYMDQDELADIPKTWADKRPYKPEFSPTGDTYPLPSCYDLYSMAYWPTRSPHRSLPG